MSSSEIFATKVRSNGDLAGVFEHDGETAYFYLYRALEQSPVGSQGVVLDAIHVLTGEPDFTGDDVQIRWDVEETKVGLFIRGDLWAVFDGADGIKYGGDYKPGIRPVLPVGAIVGFRPTSD